MQIVNLEILKHPLNWFTVLMMLVIAAIGGHLLLSWVKVEPAS